MYSSYYSAAKHGAAPAGTSPGPAAGAVSANQVVCSVYIFHVPPNIFPKFTNIFPTAWLPHLAVPAAGAAVRAVLPRGGGGAVPGLPPARGLLGLRRQHAEVEAAAAS